MKTDTILNVVLGLLTVCAVTTTGFVARRELRAPPAEALRPAPRKIADWQEYTRAGHRLGSPHAAATVVVFSDFQCPYCARLSGTLDTLRATYGADLAVVYRHFPLHAHKHAIAAAEASECAGEQGRYENFHDALFAVQDSVGVLPWRTFAARVAVPDLSAFDACLKRTTGFAALQQDTVEAQRLGVRGTPTLLVNDMELQGALPLDTLAAYIDRALGRRTR